MHRFAPALVLFTAVSASAAEQPSPRLINVATRTFPLVDVRLAEVVSARLFVSADGGNTWTKGDEIVVTPEVTPRFTFTAPSDGTYHLYSAVSYRDGTREADPVAGSEAKAVLQVDTTAPSIASFTAEARERSGSHLQVRMTWAVADEHLDAQPVTIEASLDGGASFAPLAKGGATGAVVLPVAVTAGTTTVHVRLAASDRAGNLAVSATQALKVEALPAAATPAPAVAVAAAPEVAPTPAPPADSAAGNPTPAADPAADHAADHAAALAAALAALPTVTVDPNRPDIVVPDRPAIAAAEPAATADPEVVQNQGLDQEWAEHQARSAPAPAGTGWQRQGRTAPANAANPAPAAATAPTAALTPVPADVMPAPASAETPPDRRDPGVDAPAAPLGPTTPARPAVIPPGIPPAGHLSPSQADTLLAAAREAASSGDLTLASARYRRLRDSSLAMTAIMEEIRAFREAGDPAQARAVIAGLRPNQRVGAVIIEEGRCLIALNRAPEAVTLLTQIPATGPDSAEAFYVIAQAFTAQGRTADARKLLAHTASLSGPWADRARAELGR